MDEMLYNNYYLRENKNVYKIEKILPTLSKKFDKPSATVSWKELHKTWT